MSQTIPTTPELGYKFPRDPESIPTHRQERELFTNTDWGKHLYYAAISRLLNPVALTTAAMIDVASQIGPHVVIDLPYFGGVQSGLAAMFVGRSGAGKTSTMRAADEVVTLLPDDRDGVTPTHKPLRLGGLASGQALGDRLKTVTLEAYSSNGEPAGYAYSQEHDRVLVVFDGVISPVTGSGVGSANMRRTITTALTGGSLSSVRSSREHSRDVPGGSYSASFMLGVQPDMAATLLGQEDLGFAHRWLVIPVLPNLAPELRGVILPRVEPYEAPAPAAWLEKRTRPDMTAGWLDPQNRSASELVPVDDAVAQEIRKNLIVRGRVDFDGELLDVHRDIIRLKLSLPIALLEGERRISQRAWELAGSIMAISAETRDRAIDEYEARS